MIENNADGTVATGDGTVVNDPSGSTTVGVRFTLLTDAVGHTHLYTPVGSSKQPGNYTINAIGDMVQTGLSNLCCVTVHHGNKGGPEGTTPFAVSSQHTGTASGAGDPGAMQQHYNTNDVGCACRNEDPSLSTLGKYQIAPTLGMVSDGNGGGFGAFPVGMEFSGGRMNDFVGKAVLAQEVKQADGGLVVEKGLIKSIQSVFAKFGITVFVNEDGRVTDAIYDYHPNHPWNQDVHKFLMELINSQHRIYIKSITTNKDMCDYDDNEDAQDPSKGSGSTVSWNPKRGVEVDPDFDSRFDGDAEKLAEAVEGMESGRRHGDVIPPALVLIHELLHALHGAKGEDRYQVTDGVDTKKWTDQEEERTIKGTRRNRQGVAGQSDPLNEHALAKWLNANKGMSIPVRKGHNSGGLEKRKRPRAGSNGDPRFGKDADGGTVRKGKSGTRGTRRVKVDDIWADSPSVPEAIGEAKDDEDQASDGDGE